MASDDLTCNHYMRLPMTTSHPEILAILKGHPLYPVLSTNVTVPDLYVTQMWTSLTFTPGTLTNEEFFHFKLSSGDVFHLNFDLNLFRRALHFPLENAYPNKNVFDAIPDEQIMIEAINALGYEGRFEKVSLFKRKLFSRQWASLLMILNRCLSPCHSGMDTITSSMLKIFYGVAYHKHFDYARIVWDQLITILKKKAKYDKYIPFVRFLSIMLDHFLKTKPEIPALDDQPQFTQSPMKYLQNSVGSEIAIPAPIPNYLLVLADRQDPAIKRYRELALTMVPAQLQAPIPREHREPSEGSTMSGSKRKNNEGKTNEGDLGEQAVKERRQKRRHDHLLASQAQESIVANHSHTEGASGAEANHPEVSAVSKRPEAQERLSDEAIDLDDAFGDLDNDSNFAEVQNGSDRVIPNRDVANEVPPRREFLEHVITPGTAQKIAKITNVELADKLEEIGGESLCFVSEGASRIRMLTKDVCLYRERLRKMENKAAKDAATIEQQAKTIGELTKLLTTSMENAREVRLKLEGEALESATKIKELANELKGCGSGNAKVASDISDRDKVIAEKEKEIEGLKQKLVADEAKDKEIAHLKEQLGDATEREKKLIKTQEALKKQNARSVRSKDAALSSRRLVLSEVVPHVVKTLHHSHEFNAPLSKVKKLAVQLGRQQVIQEIQETKFPNGRLEDMEGYDGTIIGKFEEACKELEEADFPYIKEIAENTGRTVDDILKVEPKGPQSTRSDHA